MELLEAIKEFDMNNDYLFIYSKQANVKLKGGDPITVGYFWFNDWEIKNSLEE